MKQLGQLHHGHWGASEMHPSGHDVTITCMQDHSAYTVLLHVHVTMMYIMDHWGAFLMHPSGHDVTDLAVSCG